MDFSAALERIKGLNFPIGENDSGELICADLKDINHLLVAGEGGTGKSIFVDSMLFSLIFKNKPDNLRIIIFNNTGVDYIAYSGIPHLLAPVITSSQKMIGALKWADTEAQKRLQAFSDAGKKSLGKYNDNAWESFLDEFPSILIILDDFSSLIEREPEAQEYISKLLLNGRTVGIYLVALTPNPTWKKSREISMSFRSKVVFCLAPSDSKSLLGVKGAEALPIPGYAFFSSGGSSPIQVKTFMALADARQEMIEKAKESGTTEYDNNLLEETDKYSLDTQSEFSGAATLETDDGFDELLPAAIEVVVESGQASVSMIQRRLKLGYGRAARLVDQMEEKGIVGPFEGAKPRQVLITKTQWNEMQYAQNIAFDTPSHLSEEQKPEPETAKDELLIDPIDPPAEPEIAEKRQPISKKVSLGSMFMRLFKK